MNSAELDRLFQQVARKIVSAEIADDPGSLANVVVLRRVVVLTAERDRGES